MPEKIHYDDNIFFMTAMVRALNDAVKLKVDADFFADRILEDTLFLDQSIEKIHASLKNNVKLIHRDAYLHSVMKLKRIYSRLLEDMLEVKGAFAGRFSSTRPKLRRIAAAHLNDVKEIHESLGKSGKNEHEMISSDELNCLMSPFEE